MRDHPSCLARTLDELLSHRTLIRGDQRPQLSRIQRRIAHDDFLRLGDEQLHELIERPTLHKHPAARTAILARVGEDAHRRTRRRLRDVGIAEDDVRRLATEFERDAFQIPRRQAHDARADLRGAGEGNFANQRMSRQRVADDAPLPRHHLERARRHARLMRELAQQNRGERRLAGRLEHHGVSCGERGRDFPAGDGEREIPRHDGRDHAHRLAQREVESAACDRDRLAAELRNRSGVILKDPRAQGDFIARIADGLADVLALQLCKRLQVFADHLRDVEEDVRSFARREIAPFALEGLLRAIDRHLHIRHARGRDLAEDLFRRRIRLRDQLAVARVLEVAVEK